MDRNINNSGTQTFALPSSRMTIFEESQSDFLESSSDVLYSELDPLLITEVEPKRYMEKLETLKELLKTNEISDEKEDTSKEQLLINKIMEIGLKGGLEKQDSVLVILASYNKRLSASLIQDIIALFKD